MLGWPINDDVVELSQRAELLGVVHDRLGAAHDLGPVVALALTCGKPLLCAGLGIGIHQEGAVSLGARARPPN